MGCRTFLLILEFRVQKEGGEGDERADEDESGALDGPFAFLHGEVEENEEDGENYSVHHSRNPDGGVVPKDPFFVDCEVKENDE